MTKGVTEQRKGLIAIIPARSGSKRLHGKNLLDLHGKPLIRWTLEAAMDSAVFDHIVVSSDDEKSLNEGRSVNAIAIKRPAALAGDTSSTTDVILHTLDVLEKQGIWPEKLMLLQPTSPLRTKDDIRASVELMLTRKSTSIISVCEAEHSPLWCGPLDEDQCMSNFLSAELRDKRSQDLPVCYRLNGAIFLIFVEVFKEHKNFFVKSSSAYLMSRENSIDIDTKNDFLVAEMVMQELHSIKK